MMKKCSKSNGMISPKKQLLSSLKYINIPKFIREFYKDKTKLGQKLPNPRIKHTKKLADGTLYHFLTWEGEKGGSWLKEDFFTIAGDEEEGSIQNLPDLTCGTRKSRDKRICRLLCMSLTSPINCVNL
jgi:hypothetical protein